VLEAYLDESGTHDGSPAMCVGGYLFTAPDARRLAEEWAKVRERENIKFFHMADCSQPPSGQLKGKTAEEVLAIKKELIALIRETAAFGAAVAVSVDEYEREAPPGFIAHYGNAYTTCLHICAGNLLRMAERAGNYYNGQIAYFFESGHKHQREANERFNNIAKSENAKREWHYTAHRFADKVNHPPCDAADFIAWHFRKFFLDSWKHPPGSSQRRKMREDFRALLKDHFTAEDSRYEYLDLSGEILKRYFTTQKAVPPVRLTRRPLSGPES
jgi:hypothetical protein